MLGIPRLGSLESLGLGVGLGLGSRGGATPEEGGGIRSAATSDGFTFRGTWRGN